MQGGSLLPPPDSDKVQRTAGASPRPTNVFAKKEILYMKATGIVRRIDDLGRVVIPKEIRRTMKIREGDPLLITLTPTNRFCDAMFRLAKRIGIDKT